MPFGIGFFKRFIASYKLNDAGRPHDLVFLFNGLNNISEIDPYVVYAKKMQLKFDVLVYEGTCQDISAYHWAAKKLDNKYLFILNSYSQILYSNWLSFCFKRFENTKIGLVGATASYQSYLSSVFNNNNWNWEFNKPVKENFIKYKLLIKAATLWRLYFKPFPNPHIRTNAFMIDRQLFLSIKFPIIKKKLDAYRFESGRNSLTAQLIKKGYVLLLINKDGNAFEINEWPKTNLFWQGLQENLLISDNQTEMFAQSIKSKKRMLSFLAWGDTTSENS